MTHEQLTARIAKRTVAYRATLKQLLTLTQKEFSDINNEYIHNRICTMQNELNRLHKDIINDKMTLAELNLTETTKQQ